MNGAIHWDHCLTTTTTTMIGSIEKWKQFTKNAHNFKFIYTYGQYDIYYGMYYGVCSALCTYLNVSRQIQINCHLNFIGLK